jgi:16S rRNA processing protein RimM
VPPGEASGDRAAAGEPRWLRAGVIGRPHGLDGSVHVNQPQPGLLQTGRMVTVGGRERRIARRVGLDARPVIRFEDCATREEADSLRGQEIRVLRDEAPELEPDEWWADDLVGCIVRDGQAEVGVVRRLLALPSCEVLEVERAQGGGELLVPLVTDAVRAVDVEGRLIDVDLGFLGE